MKRIFLCLGVLVFILTGCSKVEETSKDAYADTGFAMGTVVRQTMYAKAPEETADQILKRLIQVEEERISWRVEDSDVYNINHGAGLGKEIAANDETREWLDQILECAKDSGGIIDPTINPITTLWDIGGENPRIPKQSEIDALLPLVNYEDLVVSETGVSLKREGQALDLGAFGKGIGADCAYDILDSKEDVTGAVISVGGSILTYGSKPNKEPWNVGIENPRSPQDDQELLGSLAVNGTKHISTSGDYEKYIMQAGTRYHHIINAKDGYPSNTGIISVTVVSDSGLLSDGLSTICFILGYENSLPILEKYHAQAIFIYEDKQIRITEGLTDQFTLSAKDYTFR